MPVNAPDVVSNDAQDGVLVIANTSGSPSGSLLVGVKLYCRSCIAVGGGAPDKLGGWFADGWFADGWFADGELSADEHANVASVMTDNIK